MDGATDGRLLFLSSARFVAALSIAAIPFSGFADSITAEELLERMKPHYAAREALLARSSGRCTVRMAKAGVSVGKRLENGQEGLFGNSEDFTKYTATAEFQWTSQDDRIKYDVYIPQDENWIGGFLPQYTRIIYDKEQCIYHDVHDARAYINRPANDVASLTYLDRRFDVRKFYDFAKKDLPTHVAGFLNAGMTPRVEVVSIDSMDCYRLTNTFSREIEGKTVDERVFKMTVAPERAYSLLKGEYEVRQMVDGQLIRVQKDVYTATYRQDPAHPNVWVIASMAATTEQLRGDHFHQEHIAARFHATELGVSVDDTEFTFEAIGVPVGALVRDKRASGQSASLLRTEEGLVPIAEDDPRRPTRPSPRILGALRAFRPPYAQQNMEDTARAIYSSGSVPIDMERE